MTLILQSLYLILPAYIANMMPAVCQWIPFGGRPIQEKMFGTHKTWRGMFAGALGGIAAIGLQKILSPLVQPIELIPYTTFGVCKILLYGTAFGAGALLGDLIKSFFKRRLNIAPGKPFIPFDQLDFVFGALIAVSPLFLPPWPVIAVIIVMTPPLHLLINVIAFRLKLKDVWW